MSATNQDPSGATDPNASGGNQNNNSNVNNNNADPSGDTVAFATHKKLLGEKKKLQTDFAALQEEVAGFRNDKLSAEGKTSELLDSFKQENTDLKSRVNEYAYASVSNAVKSKAVEMGCVDSDKMVKLLNLSDLTVASDFSVDQTEVKVMVDSFKKENPFFFKSVNPNVNNDVPNKNPDLQTTCTDFSKMSIEEMQAYGLKNNL